MSYNNDGGCCNSGFSMPFVFPFPGTQNNGSGWGNSNDMFGMLMMLLFFSLFGFGGNGAGWGGRGGMPMPFMGCVGGAGSNVAAEAAAYVGAQNTADRVSGIATGVDAIAGIATANGVKLETVKDQNAAAFANLNSHLCEAFNNVAQQFNAQTLQNMNMHNTTTAMLNDMRAEQAKCCCEAKYQSAADKCEVLGAIGASEARITAKLDAAEKAALMEKINALQEQKAALKAQLDNQAQTAQILAALPQQWRGGYGPWNGFGPCSPCNPCVDGVQRAVNNALGERIGEILFPTTAATAAA